jgi:nucleotide-binding universal stress UspA family protein
MRDSKNITLTPLNIKHILCPINVLSELSQAIGYAIALSLSYKTKLFFCYCHKKHQEDNAYLKIMIEDTFKLHIAEPIHKSIDWESHLLGGEISDSICESAEELKIDLIVMESRRRPYSAALFGSTSEEVCQKAKCSVLVTHNDEKEWINTSTLEVHLRKILVACDFSKGASLALSYAISLAQKYNSELHLLYVLPIEEENKPNKHTILADAIRAFQDLVPLNTIRFDKLFYEALSGDTSNCILHYAKEYEINLICLGAHSNKQTESIFWGTTADQVIRLAPCSVLIAR